MQSNYVGLTGRLGSTGLPQTAAAMGSTAHRWHTRAAKRFALFLRGSESNAGGLGTHPVVGGGIGGAGCLFTIAYDGIVAMPQIPEGPTPRFISMNPFSPQAGPHEFLTIQVVAVKPTTRTPWSSLVPQVAEKTPDLYCWNAGWSASMATAVGVRETAAASWASEFSGALANELMMPLLRARKGERGAQREAAVVTRMWWSGRKV